MLRYFNNYFFIGFGCGVLFILLGGALFYVSIDVIDQLNNKNTLEEPVLPTDIHTNTSRADYSFSIQKLNSYFVPFSCFKGKVIFLNFWATSCDASCMEMKSLQHLYEQFKDNDNVEFILLTDEDEQTVSDFMKRNDYTIPVYFYNRDTLPSVYYADSIPAAFIIAPDGRIVYKDTGAYKWDGQKNVLFISNLIASTSPKPQNTLSNITNFSMVSSLSPGK